MRGLGLLAQDKGGSYYIGSPSLGNVIKSVYVADIFAAGAEGVHDERLIDKISATYDVEEDDTITVNNEENQQMMARMISIASGASFLPGGVGIWSIYF